MKIEIFRWVKMKGIIATLLYFGVTVYVVVAQNAITSSGANGSGSGGSVSSTIGQVFYTTSFASSGSVAQGVQQPYEISIVTGLDEKYGINLIFSVYPNPTTENLILKVQNYNKEVFTYSIYNIKGKLLVAGEVGNSETNISMKDFSPAVYFLKVRHMDRTKRQTDIKTFKIVKY